jgi:DNA-binding MarR family transcriptional regulator
MQQNSYQLSELTDVLMGSSRALIAISAKSYSIVESSVTLSQYRTLIILVTEGSQTPSELAKRLGLQPYVVTRLCDHLTEKKYITRKFSDADRRKVMVSVTLKGKALVNKVMSARKASFKEIVEKIPDSQIGTITEAFRLFAEISSSLYDEKFTSTWLI